MFCSQLFTLFPNEETLVKKNLSTFKVWWKYDFRIKVYKVDLEENPDLNQQ